MEREPGLTRRLFLGLLAAAGAAATIPASTLEAAVTRPATESLIEIGDVFAKLHGVWIKIGEMADVQVNRDYIESIDLDGGSRLYPGRIDSEILMFAAEGASRLMLVDRTPLKICMGDHWFTHDEVTAMSLTRTTPKPPMLYCRAGGSMTIHQAEPA